MQVKTEMVLLLVLVVVLLLGICACKRGKMAAQPDNGEIEPLSIETQNIDAIWQIEDEACFVIEMDRYIAEKCAYGDKMEALNDAQRIFYITQALEMEVNNGGFAQFFFNTSGAFANEIVASFEKIGAAKTAEICKKAVSIYGEGVPIDRDDREAVLVPDNEVEEERIEEILNACDSAFFACEEDLVKLNYNFIVDNKSAFLE